MEAIQKIQANSKQSDHHNIKQLNERSLMFETIWERTKAWIKVQAKKLSHINRHQQPQKIMI